MPKDKKRKRSDEDPSHTNEPDTSRPTAIFYPSSPRTSTLSIALPGSIIANAKSHDQKTYLAGTLARALAVFCVDEVVIYNDEPAPTTQPNGHHSPTNDDEGYTGLSNPSHFLAHLLSYLETPPHLRRTLFPMHANLRTAGTLPSLDMPHHLRANEFCPYREGVTTRSTKKGTFVDVGLPDQYLLRDVEIPIKTRVTIRLPSAGSGSQQRTRTNGYAASETAATDAEASASTEAEAVSPSTPREQAGYYWGYTPRTCPSLSMVFTQCPFPGGYDVSIGTSERGIPLSTLLPSSSSPSPHSSSPPFTPVPPYTHLLLVFGGVAGLETAARNDPTLQQKGITGAKVAELFDYYVNLLPGQGSRTIRTEEAVWCGLMGLQGVIEGRRRRGGG